MIKGDFETYESPKRLYPGVGEYIDEYEVLSVLGEGTFGTVFKVQNRNRRIYALKLLKLWEIAYPKERQLIMKRFVREFEITKIDSPYIVKGYDYGKTEGNPYIIMDYCEGGSLGNHAGRFDAMNASRIAHQVLCGLQELHQRGYFHRDIKPQNILLDSKNNARLTDFGIAGHKNSTLSVRNIFGKVEQIFGTWAYIAPEQANNKTAFKALDSVADIFSFGVTFFELFTGAYPYHPYKIEDETELVQYLANVRNGDYSGFQKYEHRIPPVWRGVLQKCLEPDYQNKRFKNVAEIIKVLGYKPISYATSSFDFKNDDLCIVITYGENLNKVFNLNTVKKKLASNTHSGCILTLGRKDNEIKNDIEIDEDNSAYISRRHATLEEWTSAGSWIIRDGQWCASERTWIPSLNGVYVNSKRVSIRGVIINPDDIITIGDTVLKVTVQK